MLKEQFYQALLPKWQHKLGAPKTDETFEDLCTRARPLNNMTSKLEHEDKRIRDIVSPVHQMKPPEDRHSQRAKDEQQLAQSYTPR